MTGASGFVGSALVSELQDAARYRVFGLTGKRKNTAGVENPSVQKYIRADITDYETLKKAEEIKNVETVIHTAGLAHQFGRVAREDFWKVNVQGTRNICRLAQSLNAGHFVLISSVAVYGDYGKASIDETFVCRPDGFYGESKLESENFAS